MHYFIEDAGGVPLYDHEVQSRLAAAWLVRRRTHTLIIKNVTAY